MAIKDSFIRRPTLFAVFRDQTAATPMNTTLVAATAAGAATITVTSGTNAKVGPARINSGEDIERIDIITVAGAVLTLARPTKRDHPILAVVVEQVAEDAGDVDGDVTVSMSKENTDQFSAMRFLAFTQLPGNASASIAAKILGTTLENIALCCGIPRTRIFGAGTSAAAPKVLTTDFSDVDTVNNLSVAIVSKRQDGTSTVFELWGVNQDYTQVSMQLARAQNGAVPMKAVAIGAVCQIDAAPSFTAVTTYRANKGKVFKNLTNIGVAIAGPTPTTVATAAAVDAVTVVCVDASTIVAGDWVLVNTDDQVELHWVLSKATNTLTLRTQLLRAQAVGTRVVKVTRTPFGAIAQGGATFNVGGSTNPLIVENKELPVGMQPQNAQAQTTFNSMSLALADIAAALGIPAASIANNSLLLSAALLSARIEAVYIEGVTQDGGVCILTSWGCTQDVSNWSIALGGQNPTQVPYSVKPSSGVQFVQYS